MNLKPIFFLFLLTLTYFNAESQLIDLLNPKISVDAGFQTPSTNQNTSILRSNIGFIAPIYSKFDLGFKPKSLLSKEPIKEALKSLDPKLTQILLSAKFGYNEVNGNLYDQKPTRIPEAGIGITGVHLSIKKLKPKLMVWNIGAGMIDEHFASNGNNGLYIRGLFGVGGVVNLKTLWFVGAYGQYFGNRFVGTPIIAINGRFNQKLRYSIVLPKDIKLTYIVSKKWKQDFIFGLDVNQWSSSSNILNTKNIYFQNFINLKASTRARFNLSKKVALKIEGGYYLYSRQTYLQDDNLYKQRLTDQGGAFVKLHLGFAIGKSLFNSAPIQLDF